MPRHDPPEGGSRRHSSGRASYSDPPLARAHNNLPDIVVIQEAPKNPSHLSHTSSATECTPPPPPSNRKDRKASGTPDRNDRETQRNSESLSSRESDELPESLMDAYTLSLDSHSKSNTRNRRGSKSRKSTASSPNTTPSMSSSKRKPGSGSLIIIENLPTPLGEKQIEGGDNLGGRGTPNEKTPGSANNQGSTYLTRKAHKFSSLKKKRGATNMNMLHRLFCTSPSKDEDGVERMSDHVPTVALADSEEKDDDERAVSPRKTPADEKENRAYDNLETGSGCLSLSEVMERAKDSLMLTAEADVRKSIQSAVNEALNAVHKATTPNTKKKEYKIDHENDKDDSESLASIFDHWKRKSQGHFVAEDGSDSTPAWKLKAQAAARKNTVEKKKEVRTPQTTPLPVPGSKTLFPSTIEYWEAVTTGKQTPGKPPVFGDKGNTPSNVVAQERQDSRDPPPPSSKTDAVDNNRESDEQEEALVGPSESIVSAPSDEPNLGRRVTSFGNKTSAVPQDVINQAIAQARQKWEKDELVVMQKQWEDQHELSIRKKLETEFTMERDIKLAEMQATEQAKWEAMEKERQKTLEAVEAERQKKLDEIEQEMAKLLDIQKEHLARHTPNVETERQLRELRLQLQAEKDLEIKTLKKQHERRLSDQKEQLADLQHKMQSQESLVEQYSRKSVKLEQEIAMVRTQLEEAKSTTNNASRDNRTEDEGALDTLAEEHNAAIAELKQKHTEDIGEIKEKLKREHAVSIEAIKASMEQEHAKNLEEIKAEHEQQLSELQSQVEQLQNENETLLASNAELHVERDTLAGEKRELEATYKILKETSESLQNEKTELWEKLAAAEIDHMAVVNQLRSNHQKAVDSVQQENDGVVAAKNTKIQELESKIDGLNKEFEAKLIKVKEEVESEKHHLALREQTLHAREELVSAQEEIAAAQKEKAAQAQASTPPRKRGGTNSPTRSPNRSPTRSSSKVQKTNGKTPLRKSESLEVLEMEKESLQKQIKVLEAQASETSLEHERTLHEFRSASEQEILRLKKELERRQEEHSTRENELKESLAKVDSWEKEELLEKIEQLEWDKKNDRTSGLKEVQKKEELLQKISLLERNEKKLLEDHETALADLRETSAGEVQRLKDEIERQQELHRARERELSESLSATSSFDKDELLKKIETLEAELENEKNTVTVITLKLQAAEKDYCANEASHLEELSSVRDRSEVKIAEITQEMNDMKQKVENAEKIEEELQIANGKIYELETELNQKITEFEETQKKLDIVEQDIKEATDKALESGREEIRGQIENLRKTHKAEVERLRADASKNLYETKKEAEDKVKKLQEDHESILDSLKALHKEHLDKMVAEAKQEAEDQKKSSSQEEVALRQKILDLEEEKNDCAKRLEEIKEKLALQTKESEERVRQVSEKHTRELDDLIGQLDLLESEQKEKFEQKDNEIQKKQQQIYLLDSQLADAKAKAEAAEALNQKIEELSEVAETAQEQVETLTKDLESLQEAHEKYVEEAEELKEAACDEAREEMIERAEVQFRQANELYVKLKKQYDNSKAKADRLDKELKETRRKMECAISEKNELDVSLRAELASVHADNAKIEADSAQRAKDYRKEMEGLLQAAKDFEQKADAAESLSRNVQKTLAALVVEKDKLERAHQALQEEHEEMKQVCEELMAELEGRNNY